MNVPVSDGTPCTQQFDVYESELIRVYDSKGMEKGEQVSDFVQKLVRFIGERRTTADVESNIHIVWYTVDAVACRFDDGDAEIIKELFKLLGKRSLFYTQGNTNWNFESNILLQNIAISETQFLILRRPVTIWEETVDGILGGEVLTTG